MPAYDGVRFAPPAPLAFVVLRHLQTRVTVADVPMLIDSGADVTLIPREQEFALGLAPDAGQGYELVGFDGTKSVAESVQLDLLFLRRAFGGRFLLIDQEWGISDGTSSITSCYCSMGQSSHGAKIDRRVGGIGADAIMIACVNS
jgi:hypothetical protein